jgi:hypothetical protein
VIRVKFFEFLSLHNYCEGIMIFTALIAFIFSLRHYGRNRAFRIIPFYIGSCLLLETMEFIKYVSPGDDRLVSLLEQITIGAFTVFEFCVFSLLILHYIAGPARRLAIKLNALLYFIGVIFLYLGAFPQIPVYPMSQLELIALVPPCVIYFYELFTSTSTRALKDRPSFWLVTGIICLGAFSLMSMLTIAYIGRFADGAYALGNLFYCILFVLFMRAYKCSPEELVVA